MEIPPVMGIVIHPRIESHTFERLIQEFGEFVYFFFREKIRQEIVLPLNKTIWQEKNSVVGSLSELF